MIYKPDRGCFSAMRAFGCFFAVWFCLSLPARAEESAYFSITVIDETTGRGVPLVELRTVNELTYITDSNGIAAVDEPGLMDREVFFHIRSHGYEYPKDGFGYRGAKLRLRPGGSETLKIARLNIAERLYRITGAGIYGDSVRAGVAAPIERPVLNGQVLGSDSVLAAEYRGKIFWFWGDTNRPGYPLGNFHVSGATSAHPRDGGLDPAVGINLAYFTDENGFARKMAPMPGKGPTWLDGLTTVPDAAGKERLVASYMKVEPPMKIYERGLAVFDDEKSVFTQVLTLNEDAPILPEGHSFRHTEEGKDYIYFAQHPYPFVRVPATFEAWQDSSQYEAFTCLRKGARFDAPQLDRDAKGKLVYGWKKDTPVVDLKRQDELVARGKMEESEGWIRMRARDGGHPVAAHHGSVNWNAYRKRWVMIFVESGGESSYLGEVWYAEAERPEGPWSDAVKIVTHDNYSFYNPKHHPFFDQEGGRVIYFEGTYTKSFAKDAVPTPRYDYNQVMYRLDLADERLGSR